MEAVRSAAAANDLGRLTISLTDERYGLVGHKDSNWKQLADAGFDFSRTNHIPVLRDLPLDETVRLFGDSIGKALGENDLVIAQFGIGSDGHIAGILPDSLAIADTDIACSYEAAPFTRITLTPAAFAKVSVAYAFVFGASKREAIERLRDRVLPLEIEPAQLLKGFTEAFVYSDQL